MSFLAKINMEGHEMNVLDCSFTFSQGADNSGRPSQKANGGQISVLLESDGKTNFLDWAISSSIAKEGKIIFFKRDKLSNLKSITFKEAYCLEYTEDFNSEGEDPLKTKIVISAKEITLKGINFKNNWPVKV